MRYSSSRLVAPVLAAVALLSSSALAQTVIYVDKDATGADDGSSWTNAFVDLQDALAVASDPAQIWVAQGSYRPTDGTDREATFQLKSGVALYGGFVGTETSVDQRNPDPNGNRTSLSCNIGRGETPIDNCYHVVTATGVDDTAVLDGFGVYDGYATEASPHDRGAGLSNYDGTPTRGDDEGYPTLRNLYFSGHFATYGAGVYLNGADGPVTFENVTFERNKATLQGGGMYVNTDVEMESVAFVANRADTHGGGAWFSGGESVLRDVTFESNELIGTRGDQYGGGAHVLHGTKLTLIDVVFKRNRVSGQEIGHGGALSVRREAEVDIVNAAFIGNTGRDASGILAQNNAVIRVVNAVFAGHGKTATGFGVINGWDNARIALTNVTMSGNDADYVVGTGGTVTIAVNNVIIWGNTGTAFDSDDDVEVNHAIIEGGFSGGESVLTDNPLFVRAPDAGADGEWGTDDDDYGDLRLREGSPALNVGDLDHISQDHSDLDDDGVTDEQLPFDLNRDARVQNSGVDLGPYEGAAVVVASESDVRAGHGLRFSTPAPNPTRGPARIVLHTETAGPVDVGVYDLLGRQLVELHAGAMAAGERTFEIDGDALPAGIYVLRASSPLGTATRRMTVVR